MLTRQTYCSTLSVDIGSLPCPSPPFRQVVVVQHLQGLFPRPEGTVRGIEGYGLGEGMEDISRAAFHHERTEES